MLLNHQVTQPYTTVCVSLKKIRKKNLTNKFFYKKKTSKKLKKTHPKNLVKVDNYIYRRIFTNHPYFRHPFITLHYIKAGKNENSIKGFRIFPAYSEIFFLVFLSL